MYLSNIIFLLVPMKILLLYHSCFPRAILHALFCQMDYACLIAYLSA